jgi:MFS family permease
LAALWWASRTLHEVGESKDSSRPDLAGAVMFAVAIGLLALGIVQGRDWGWGSPEIVGSFVASALLVVAFGWRSAHHPAPVIEPAILRVRSFAVANLATALFFAAFGAMLLTNITFLTEVWGYSTLTAGLALAPGPVMAAVFSVPAGRLSDRFGQRAVAIPGGLLCAAGFVWAIWQVGPSPAYAADFLPGWLVGGAGVGLSISTLASAAAASLPPERFATGTGVFGMSRQIGTALGIAVTVAILAGASASNPMDAFDSAWTFMALTTFAVAVVAVALGRVRVAVPIARAEAPAEARA